MVLFGIETIPFRTPSSGYRWLFTGCQNKSLLESDFNTNDRKSMCF